jgi:hypothetical protein
MLKNAVFWDVAPCGSCKNRRFGLTYRLHHQGDNRWAAARSLLRFLVTANVVHSSPILITLMIETIHSSETPGLTRTTRRNIPEDGIFHIHHRENLKSKLCSSQVLRSGACISLTSLRPCDIHYKVYLWPILKVHWVNTSANLNFTALVNESF